MEKIKEYKELIIVLIFILGIFFIFQSRNREGINYNNEISKQDLVLKCQEIYNIKHIDVENYRYGGQLADTIIWSPKSKTCLAYYNVKQQDPYSFLFEVWDYTNTDLVLSYKSELSNECVLNNTKISMQSFIYKYNKKLEGSGCDLILMKSGTDLLTNFEKSMVELGFKK